MYSWGSILLYFCHYKFKCIPTAPPLLFRLIVVANTDVYRATYSGTTYPVPTR